MQEILLPYLGCLHHAQGHRTCLGVEWNGMEWNGMEWNGMEWNGVFIFQHVFPHFFSYLRHNSLIGLRPEDHDKMLRWCNYMRSGRFSDKHFSTRKINSKSLAVR